MVCGTKLGEQFFWQYCLSVMWPAFDLITYNIYYSGQHLGLAGIRDLRNMSTTTKVKNPTIKMAYVIMESLGR